jgi:hypothetical protein
MKIDCPKEHSKNYQQRDDSFIHLLCNLVFYFLNRKKF